MTELYRISDGDKRNHVRIIHNHPTAKTPLHMHDYFEIELVLSGKCKQLINGNVYNNISRGSLYLLSPVDFHRLYDFEEKLHAINVCFDNYFYSSDIVQIFMNNGKDTVIRLNDEEIEQAQSIISLLKESCETNDQFTERNVKHMLEYFLIFILRKSESGASISHSAELSQIQKGIQYLYHHYRENPPLEKIAKICGYAPGYFCKQFKSMTGKTYIEFLNSLKINYAKILLLTGQTPIIEIVEICGFNSVSNFNRVFKEKLGVSPSEFAKTNKQR